MELCKAKVLTNEKIAAKDGFYLMELLAPSIARQARPGQFLMITVDDGDSPFLKRPMGINMIDPQNGSLRIIYQLKGIGTKKLSQIRPGTHIDVLGPSGNGWYIPSGLSKICLIGGGSGAASLLPLAQTLKKEHGADIDLILGGRTVSQLICLDEFNSTGRLFLATEDGSLGKQGMIDIYLDNNPEYDQVYCCGPTPMMQAVAAWAAANDLPCQVSLEERMGCGYGVCMGCVCATKSTDSQVSYKRVCREGPVFDSREVFAND